MDEEYFLERALFPHLDDPSDEDTPDIPVGYFDNDPLESEEEDGDDGW